MQSQAKQYDDDNNSGEEIWYDIPYVQYLERNKTNELMYETGTGSQS